MVSTPVQPPFLKGPVTSNQHTTSPSSLWLLWHSDSCRLKRSPSWGSHLLPFQGPLLEWLFLVPFASVKHSANRAEVKSSDSKVGPSVIHYVVQGTSFPSRSYLPNRENGNPDTQLTGVFREWDETTPVSTHVLQGKPSMSCWGMLSKSTPTGTEETRKAYSGDKVVVLEWQNHRWCFFSLVPQFSKVRCEVMQTHEQREGREGERSRGRENGPKSLWLQDTVKAEKKNKRAEKQKLPPNPELFFCAWSPTSQIGIEGCGKDDWFLGKKQVSRRNNNHKVWSTHR